MRAMLLGVMLIGMMSGCGLQWQTVEDAPKGGFKKIHHTITFETEPQCVGSCDPSVKSW